MNGAKYENVSYTWWMLRRIDQEFKEKKKKKKKKERKKTGKKRE